MARKTRKATESPSEFFDFVQRVEQLLKEEDWEKAHSELQSHKRAYSNLAEFHYLWGRYHQAIGEHDSALQYLLRAIEIDPTDWRFYRDAADVYAEQAKLNEAINILQSGKVSAKDAFNLYPILIDHAVNLRDCTLLDEVVEEFRQQYGDTGPFLYRTAVACYRAGLIARSLDALRLCTDAGYTGEHHYWYLALICTYFENLYDLSDAVLTFYRKQLARNPRDADLLSEIHAYVVSHPDLVDDEVRMALWQKIGTLSNKGGNLADSLYFITEQDADRIFTRWVNERLPGIEFDYVIFSEIHLYLSRNPARYPGIGLDPGECLKHTAARLRECRRTREAVIFESWLEALDGDVKQAERGFSRIVFEPPNSDEISSRVERLKHEGEEYIEREAQQGGEGFPPLESSDVEDDEDEGILSYGVNLSKTAEDHFIVGLDSVVRRMAEIISRATVKSIVLTGPSGVGKTAAIKALAKLLRTKSSPTNIRGGRIFSDFNNFTAFRCKVHRYVARQAEVTV